MTVDDQDSLGRGLGLLRTGEWYRAHEELEDAWRTAPAADRDFLQGLVHVAVAWYQAGRGNPVGCERQLAKAMRRLSGYGPTYRGVDLTAVLGSVAAAAGIVATGSLVLPSPRGF